MPTIVDHDARRLDIAAAVKRLASRQGIQSVTVREVGREAGFSATIVGHYFKNKNDLMTFTYRTARSEANERMESLLNEGASALECVIACLPLDEERQMEWQMWVGYWGLASSEASIAEERRLGVSESYELFKKLFETGQQRGEIPASLDCDELATRFQCQVNGLATIALQVPEKWPPERQRQALQREWELLLHSMER